MPRVPCSLYPLASTPPNVLLRVAGEPWGWKEEAAIAGSSLFIVGSFLWVPALYVWAYRKWKAVKDPRRKALYGALLLAGTALFVAGPHRRPSFGQRVGFQKWKIWKIWCQFVALEIWNDSKQSAHEHYKKSQSITAFVPHGIFPFSIGLAAIPEIAAIAFGRMRIMVATATNLFPFVRDIISLVHSVDASRPAVHRALTEGSRIGLLPGGIPEIFEGYPNKPLTHPDDEFAIVPRGFVKMALRHNLPIVPVYCFGATKMFKRLQLPSVLEKWSLMLRISICLFFGVAGLPIPFRQKIFYVMGDSLKPNMSFSGQQGDASLGNNGNLTTNTGPGHEEEMVVDLHQRFCEELMRLFENHKELYGWGHKTLHLLAHRP